MVYENLIPKDLSKREDHIELSRKGGLSKSPSKVLSSRINGLMNSKKLSGEQKYMLALLKNKKFIDLIIELISMNLEDINRPERRDKVIDQLSKFLPNRNLNMNYNKTEESNVLTAKDFSDAWKKIKEEESNQKSDKCDMIRD